MVIMSLMMKDMESLLKTACNDILIDYKDFHHNDSGYQLSIVSDYKLVPQNVEVIGFRFAYYPNEDYLVEEENEDELSISVGRFPLHLERYQGKLVG